MRSKKRLILSTREWFNYHWVAVMFVGISGVQAYFILSDLLFNGGAVWYLQWVGLGSCLVLVAFLFWLGRRRRTFLVFAAQLDPVRFQRAAIYTGEELGWRFRTLRDDSVVAYRPSEQLSSACERITILRHSDRIFINSVQAPDVSGSVYSNERNRENVVTFLRNAADMLEGKDVSATIETRKREREEAFWESPEWTLPKTMMRLLGYSLLALFLLVAFEAARQEEWDSLVAVALPGLGIILTFVRADVLIIREKWRRRRSAS
ncbi:MAG: hypothetical protein KDC54_02915 [Lewinella sp.]|nr:hypothetical protein [Lewinella sp.]